MLTQGENQSCSPLTAAFYSSRSDRGTEVWKRLKYSKCTANTVILLPKSNQLIHQNTHTNVKPSREMNILLCRVFRSRETLPKHNSNTVLATRKAFRRIPFHQPLLPSSNLFCHHSLHYHANIKRGFQQKSAFQVSP